MGDAATTQPQPHDRPIAGRAGHAGLAIPLWLVSLALAAGVVVLLANIPPEVPAAGDPVGLVLLAVVVAYATVGAMVARRRPESYAGWTLLGLGLSFGLTLLLVAWTYVALPPSTRDLPGGVAALWLSDVIFTPILALFATLFLLFFPDGTLPTRKWRIAVGLIIASVLLFAVAESIQPGFPYEDHPTIANPFGAPAAWAATIETLTTIGNAGMVAGILLAAISLVARYRTVSEIERHQIKWIAVVGAAAAITLAISSLQVAWISEVAWIAGLLLFALLPVAIGIAIMRYRLYEIDDIVNRALVYGGVTAILSGIFAASMTLSQRLFVGLTGQASDAAIVITTLILTAAYTPVRHRVEAVVDRSLRFESHRFGAYREQLGHALEVLEPSQAREHLVREAVAELGATAGAVLAANGDVLTPGTGWTDPSLVRIDAPLGRDGERLVLGRRRDGRAYSPQDAQALRDVAELAGRTMSLVAAPSQREPVPATTLPAGVVHTVPEQPVQAAPVAAVTVPSPTTEPAPSSP